MTKQEKKLYDKIDKYNTKHSDMPDGAFYALAESEYGIDIYDWAWYAEKQGKLRKLK